LDEERENDDPLSPELKDSILHDSFYMQPKIEDKSLKNERSPNIREIPRQNRRGMSNVAEKKSD
jgi:hypothetical protein